ncbi:MAG: DNA replication and repair protein RecF, partial [Myxococcota bacterium]
MHVEHLEARNFRNLEPVNLPIHPGFVVVQGPNAQGKTNTLEALYVCATGKSFRNAPPRELVRHNEEGAKLRAIFSRQGVRHEIEVTLTTRRSIRVDGRALRKTSQLLDLVNVVAFFPDDLRIIKGSPEERRRFLDRAVSNYRSELVDAAASYEKALRSRNRILRENDAPPRELLDVYDVQLCAHGAVIHRCRTEVLAELKPIAESIFSELMGETTPLELSLDSGVPDSDDAADFEAHMAKVLNESYRRDVGRRSTNFGPHRADMRVVIQGREAKSFGSQGQQRATVL